MMERDLTFDEAVRDGLSKYVQFDGRSSRSAYWWFYLFYILVFIGASIIDAIAKTPVFGFLAVLGLLLPSLSVLVRRLHDTDRSGWWVLISFVPIVGTIVVIVFACTDSGPPNKYGNGPDGNGDLTVISPHGGAFPPPPPPPPPASSPPPPPPASPGPPSNEMPPPQASDRAPD
ncbi:MAG TPA: DUF805 domain-containing protein [Solirubrobacterales bacterium]|jgi:uncharacterized membrane protein YhaH (DUF805 family)|nr:DUF805 domain-containing protein [Solirubrobacterales bacterium]